MLRRAGVQARNAASLARAAAAYPQGRTRVGGALRLFRRGLLNRGAHFANMGPEARTMLSFIGASAPGFSSKAAAARRCPAAIGGSRGPAQVPIAANPSTARDFQQV
jgi:hypothetical protein